MSGDFPNDVYVSMVQMGDCKVCGEYQDLRMGACFGCSEFVDGKKIDLITHELWDSRSPENKWKVRLQ